MPTSKPTPRKQPARKSPPARKPTPKLAPSTSSDEEWQQFVTEYVPLASLKPHPRNYQSHPADEIEEIKASLREHGWFRPIIVARENTVLGGHGVREAAMELGWTHGPVVRKDYDPMEPRALKIMVADNEIRHLAERDDRSLTSILKELADANELLGTGYDDMMLANLMMVTRPPDTLLEQDASAEWIGMPEYDAEGEKRVSIIVNFATLDDRRAFCERLDLDADKIPLEGARKSIWWPPRARRDDDNTAIRFANWGPKHVTDDGESDEARAS